MSVVNKMLKDLEARQSKTDNIDTDYHAPQKKQSNILILILLVISIAAITFALVYNNQLFGESKNTDVTSSKNTQPLSLTAPIKKMTVLTDKSQVQPQLQLQIASTQSTEANIELVMTKTNVTSAITVLDEAQVMPNELEMAINNSAILPKIETQNVDSQNKQINPQDDIMLNIQTAPEQTSRFSMSGSSQENNVSSLKQRIAESLKKDKLDLAQSLLHKLLETEPNNIKARKKLAALLFAQGNYAQAKQLLVRGIELHPSKSDIRLMLARLYMIQKAPSKAMNILAEFQPSRDNQIEYLAYRAALAQQLKQTTLAKSDYQTLTTVESDNAKWWLGLAITEDQLGEINMALQAYNTASSLSQLDSSVNQFIQQRMTVLTGAQ
jgi:MSHA biogenesis protein MshN